MYNTESIDLVTSLTSHSNNFVIGFTIFLVLLYLGLS